MAKQETNYADPPDSTHEPNFVMPNRDVIREDNWEEYRAQGFRPYQEETPTPLNLRYVAGLAGTQNVYTGERYDEDAGRPLHHKPGKSIYLSPEGSERLVQRVREYQDEDSQSSDDPAAN